jgi:Peptidase family C25
MSPASLESPFGLNGINGTTGAYLSAPSSLDALYASITNSSTQTQVLRSAHYDNLRAREDRRVTEDLGVAAGIDHKKLEETGWGVLFCFDAPPALLEALRPLLEHRKAQATKNRKDGHYREFIRDSGYNPGDTKTAFLKRLGRAPGQPADPRRGVPYYLLIVGSPREIPWSFQYDLDVEYAVGRIYFETDDGKPDYEAYHRYAQSVVLVETLPSSLPPTAAFFAPNHDAATQFSSEQLVVPTFTELVEWSTDRNPGWQFSDHLEGNAGKSRLTELLGGGKTPALLFTASHGIGFDRGDSRQLAHQGAIVCQDIGPVQGAGPVPEKAYFSANDVADDARLHGLISFHFACFAAGTPDINDFPDADKVFRDQQIAPFPFVARLPQKLLAHPRGGALAFVGHVDRAWTTSFLLSRTDEPQIDTFLSLAKDLIDGSPVGHAVEFFNDRYAERATALTSLLNKVRMGRIADEAFKSSLASTWLDHNDARNYVILGDPAVRLSTVAGGAGHADQSGRIRRLGTSPPGSDGAAPFAPDR